MQNLPSLANSSEFYQLLYQDLLKLRPSTMGDLKVFMESEFENYYPTSKWRELVSIAPENMDGNYTQFIGKTNTPVMASYVAVDGEAPLIGNEGFRVQTKDMPTMKLAYNFNAKSARDQHFLTSNFGRQETGKILDQFIIDTANLLAGLETKNSHVSLQIESKGSFLSTAQNNGGGLVGLKYDFGVPTINKRLCGAGNLSGNFGTKNNWDNANAFPIGDLQDITQFVIDRRLFPIGEGVLRMSKKTFNKLKNHASTREALAVWVTDGGINPANTGKYPVRESKLREYLIDLGIPPIEVEDWASQTLSVDPKTNELVRTPLSGFADDTVLLRRGGIFGEMQWMKPTTLFATSVNPMYLTNGNMYGVQQDIQSTAKSMKFTAEFTGMIVPDNVEEFIYLDVSTASS